MINDNISCFNSQKLTKTCILKVDPETRKAREKVRNELYETERKSKSSKMIIPKCYFVPKYWDHAANSGIRLKEDEMKHLEKFRVY